MAKVRNSPYYHISVGEISVAQLTPLELQTLSLLLADQPHDADFDCSVSRHNMDVAVACVAASAAVSATSRTDFCA